MVKVKIKPKMRVQLTLTVTEARYVYACLNKCRPNPMDLFSKDEEFADPIYDALYEALIEAGVSTNVMLARTIHDITGDYR